MGKKAVLACLFGTLISLFLARSSAAQDEHTQTIRIATLAPAESPWGQVLQVWQRAVRERSKLPGGAKTAEAKDYTVDIAFYWNGQQGDEDTCVAKMKSGQIDGAAVTAVGLSQIYKPVMVLELPGLIRDWETLDKVRAGVQREFEKAFNAAGYRLSEIGGFGMGHVMSRGFPVGSPADLRGKKPFVWRNDPISPVVMQIIGGITTVPLSVPEVLGSLTAGSINVVNAPALAAEQLQWTSRLDHMGADVDGIGVGAMLLNRARLDELTADEQAMLHDTGKVTATALNLRIRREEALSFDRLSSKMTVNKLTTAQQLEWYEIFRQSHVRLGQGVFSKELVERVEKLAGFK